MGNYDRKSSPCTGCMRAVKWIPVIFIVAILVWSYYAYIVQFSILTIDSVLQKIIYLIAYHVLFGLFLWSYWKTIFAPIGTVPPQWRISDADVERLFRAENQEEQKRILEIIAKDLPVSNRTANGSIRFCDKCHIIKPDRAHHCSVCGQCVLKMDHHCPWVNNCVNFSNYKYFVLFLGYALVYCLYVALTSLEYFIKFWRGQINVGMGRFHILFLFCISLMFAVSLISLFSYHVYLVLVNRTTLESFRAPIFRIGGPDKNGYNLGKCANFQEVFGDNWKLWFFPVFTSSGDGLVYRTNSRHQSASYNSMGATQTRLEQPHDKFLEQTIDNLPLDHLTGNANDNLILNPNNIANGNVIIDKNNSNTETHCFIVNEVNDANVRNSNELASATASNGKTTIRSGVTITGESTHPQPDSLLII